MFEEITRMTLEGKYEAALGASKKLAVDLLHQNQREEAAMALARGGEILCRLNHPLKARSFATESLDLATRGRHAETAGYARAVNALAHLRLAEYERAEQLADQSLEHLSRRPEDERTAFACLVAAEISVTREDYAEARSFAEDAFTAGAAVGRSSLKANACLIKAICEDRVGQPPAALQLLETASAELQREPDVQIAWMIQGAMANVYAKLGREKEAATCRKAAREMIDKVSRPLSEEMRLRFLQNPALQSALGEGTATESGLWKTPLQIVTPVPPKPAPSDPALVLLRPILDMIKKINSELNLRKLLTTIVDTMIETCNAQRGTIVIFDGAKFKVEISRNGVKQDMKRFEMGISRTILKQCRDQGHMIILDDAQGSPDFRLTESVHDQSLLSILCVPLRVKTRLVGAVYLDNPVVVGAFGPKEIGLAEILTDHAAVAIDNALLHIKSIHDGLTSLYNHTHFEKRIESEVARARRHGRSCSLLMIDIDDFKKINDTHGHEVGNDVLRQIGRLLTTTVRTVDLIARIQELDTSPVVARYGGDEFEILLPDTGREGLQSAGDRLLQALGKEQFFAAGKPLSVTSSMGGAVFPQDAPDARELALRADEALYAAKRAGKNRFCVYPVGKQEAKIP